MNLFIKDIIFCSLIVSLIFTEIPLVLRFNLIGGSFAHYFAIYPLYLIIFLSICFLTQNNLQLFSIRKIMLYALVSCFLAIVSLFLGAYNLFDSDSINIIGTIDGNKIKRFLLLISDYFDLHSEKNLIVIGIAIRNLKTVLIDLLLSIGGTYFIYLWYKNRSCNMNKIIGIGFYVSLFIISAYSFVEIFYLLGSDEARLILEKITPFFHRIKGPNDYWWPPLLWPNQLRSVFAEPSFFACYIVCVLPYFWSKVYSEDNHSKLTMFLIWLLSSYLFLTKTRSGTLILMLEILILIFLSYITRKRFKYKKCLLILFLTVTSFVSSMFLNSMYGVLNNNEQYPTSSIVENTNNYVSSNVKSLSKMENRSNKARFIMNYSSIMIGIDNPFFGVGKGFRSAYVERNIPNWGIKDHEVSMWIENYHKQGILQYNFPLLGEYTARFAEGGLLGLFVFLLPPLILIYKLYQLICSDSYDYNLFFLTLSLFAIMVFGFSTTIFCEYIYWILLAYGYIYVEDKQVFK